MGETHPLAGLKVLELGSRVAVPYIGKLFADAGAEVLKVESPRGDPFRQWSASGSEIPRGADGAWWRFLNAGKRSTVLDLSADEGLSALAALVAEADLVLDDHLPAEAEQLAISAAQLRAMNPAGVVATVTPFGAAGPWANRPANEFVLQALVGATNGRGVPGQEPASVGGDLGDFVVASHAAAPILGATLAARAGTTGVHLDISQYEAMMLAFQTYRPMYETFAPTYRIGRQIEIPSVEPASDGLVGFCPITGQQWKDFCAMIGATDFADDPELSSFDGRMAQRDRVWPRIREFTRNHSVDELVELAVAFRIPVGPIGTGDKVAEIDHFAERGVYVTNPHGFTQPRPPYLFSHSELAPLREAPPLGDHAGFTGDEAAPSFGAEPAAPLMGVKVLDLSAFWAGPVATNVLRMLGADLVKVESHVHLDGMRWASGLPISVSDRLWEWSPVYHGANVGKTVLNLDLNTASGRAILDDLIAQADLVIENYSPRVTEAWGLTWERIQELNPRASFMRVPAFGTSGPWRDRVGFAMTMEQVSGLANRTGHRDGDPVVPRGPVDSIAGMHLAFAAELALVERERLGHGQLIELPLIEGALQAAAEQVVEYSAYGRVLGRIGNRSAFASPQGLYRTSVDDAWLAVSVETDEHWDALVEVVGDELPQLDRHRHLDRIDDCLARWAQCRSGDVAAAELWTNGVPAAPCVHFNDTGRSPQHDFRGFFQWRKHPITGWTPYHSFSFQVDGEHPDLGAPAPLLGQHNNEVLFGLGFSEAQVAELWHQGVTGDWPSALPRPAE